MISMSKVYSQLEKQKSYISIVELAMMLEANTSEVRQRLNQLGDRVVHNEHDEWCILSHFLSVDPVLPSLSTSEIKERDELENTVQQAFLLAGNALKILRDKKLYRETHSTFELYAKERFDFSKSSAYYLISASEVVDNLKCPQIVDENEVNQYLAILPTRESQCRPIAKLPAERQREVWYEAVKQAHGKVPSARIVKEIVSEIRGKSKLESNFRPKAKNEIIHTAGLGIEHIAYLDEETNYLLEAYQEKIGAATKNGAIRRLLDAENQRTNS